MSDAQTDSLQVWTTGFVERAIEQPVKRAVREALSEYDAERAVTQSDEPTGDDSGVEEDVDEADVSDDTADTSRVGPFRLLLLAGALAGASYVAMRRRRSGDDEPDTLADEGAVTEIRDADVDEHETDADDTDADEHDIDDTDADEHDIDDTDATPEGERSTAPVEDATTN